MSSRSLFKLIILFFMAGVIASLSVRSVSPVIKGGGGRANTAKQTNREVVYRYKSPDGTTWTHNDKEALVRLKEHYSLNSPKVFNRMEAERQPIEKSVIELSLVQPPTPAHSPVWWNDIIIGACTLVIGIVSLYALSSAGETASHRSEEQKHDTVSMEETSDPQNMGIDEMTGEDEKVGLSLRFKGIIIELLYHLVKFSQENPDLKSDRFKELVDEYVAKLRTMLPPDELSIIENELKKLVSHQWHLIKSLIEGRDKELKALIASFVESMNFFDRDNAKFTLNMNNNLNNIEKVLTLNEIKEIRRRVTDEIGHARKSIEEKRQSDSKKIEELSVTVKSLDRELSVVKKEAQHDGLTGLYNRKTFDNRLTEMIYKGKARGTTFSLALIDIDHFKRINDTHGHTVGDDVLRNMSAYLKSALDKEDFIARYGGEEFAVILDEGNRTLVHKIFENLRKNISMQKLINKKSPVTVSIGVAFCKWHDTPESLIRRADEALYTAKRSGRNMVVPEETF